MSARRTHSEARVCPSDQPEWLRSTGFRRWTFVTSARPAMFFAGHFSSAVWPSRLDGRVADSQTHKNLSLTAASVNSTKSANKKLALRRLAFFCGGFSPVRTCATVGPFHVCPSSPDLTPVVSRRKLCADAISPLNFCNCAAGKQLCGPVPAPWVAYIVKKAPLSRLCCCCNYAATS